jgi:hypothetical protein
VSYDHQVIEIEVESRLFLVQKPVSRANVVEGSGPSAAGVADAPVLHVESRNACRAQRLA